MSCFVLAVRNSRTRFALNTFIVCVLALAYSLVLSPVRASAQVILKTEPPRGGLRSTAPAHRQTRPTWRNQGPIAC